MKIIYPAHGMMCAQCGCWLENVGYAEPPTYAQQVRCGACGRIGIYTPPVVELPELPVALADICSVKPT